MPLPSRAPEAKAKASEIVELVKAGYSFEGAALEIGALVNGDAVPEAQIRIPLAHDEPARAGGRRHRHGQDPDPAGAGRAARRQGRPGVRRRHQGRPLRRRDTGRVEREAARAHDEIGQDWQPAASVTEYFALGGIGKGVPVRATVGVRAAAAEQGAGPQRDAGVEPRARLPLRRRERWRSSTSPICAPC